MKRSVIGFVSGLILGLFVGFLLGGIYSPKVYTEQPQIVGVYFSPNGGCESAVLTWISKANSSIHVLIYSFTLDSIGNALVEAHQRGIEVKAVFEKSQISQYSEYNRLRNAGISVRNDTNPDLMHDKVMIVDSNIVLTGSFNWSANAQENNNENLIVISSRPVANAFEINFQKIWTQGT